jgi:hypothetical protein
MSVRRIHLASNPDQPYGTVKRQWGKLNAGLYCSHCSEFFALAVVDPRQRPIPEVEYVAEGPLLFECPLCHQQQTREASEIAQLQLTAGNRRKPRLGPGIH